MASTSERIGSSSAPLRPVPGVRQGGPDCLPNDLDGVDGLDEQPHGSPISLLWIDDELESGDPLLTLLALEGISADVAPSGAAGIAMARAGGYDAIILDLRLPDLFGLTVLRRLLDHDPRIPVVIVTGYYSEPELETEALAHGAAGFHLTPVIDTDAFVASLRSIVHGRRVTSPDASETFGIVATSQEMRNVGDWIRRVGPTGFKVLLTGETGTGKELVARALHSAGPRRGARFVSVNCGAIPETLIESELFGHRKGAFTGAVEDKVGLFEIAAGGTLFLDEIGDLPMAMQARLLRYLDDGELRRVGETSERRIDARVIAATNRDLRSEVASDRFRADLYYRLCAAHCHIPPLRNRPEDIDALVDHWLPAVSACAAVPVMGISGAARAVLRAHAWPGNVRELRHVLDRAVVSASRSVLTERDIYEALEMDVTAGTPSPSELPRSGGPLSVGDQRLLSAVEHHHWNRSAAASSLGISRSTLWRALKRLGVGRGS